MIQRNYNNLKSVLVPTACVAMLFLEIYALLRLGFLWESLRMLSGVKNMITVPEKLLQDLMLALFAAIILLLGFTGMFLFYYYKRCLAPQEVEKEQPAPLKFETALETLWVDTDKSVLAYGRRSTHLPKRAALLLAALADREEHTLQTEDFDLLYGKGYYDGLDSGKIRSIKHHARKALAAVEAPIDVVKHSDGRFSLVPKENVS